MVRIGKQLPDPDHHGRDQAVPQATLNLWQGNGEIPALHSVDAKRAPGGLNHHSLGRSLIYMGRKLPIFKNCSLSPKLRGSPSFHLKNKHTRLSFTSSPHIPPRVN